MQFLFSIFWKIRVLLFYFFIALISITVIPIISFTKYLNISYGSQYKLAKLYSELFLFGLKFFCGINIEVFGLEKIPNAPFVILPNHQSFADNFIMPVIFPVKQSWIMKKELLSYPLLGSGLKVLNPIAIDRTQSFSVRQIISQGSEKIKQGLCVVIYPEATRVSPYKNIKFKPSGIKLAQEAQVAVIMVAHNAGLYWPKGFWVKKSGTIKIIISDPISKEECINTPVRELNDKVEKWITDKKNELINIV
jgi:1-acyl-sn-glycerol-3-phosphate acyltransferase